VVIGGLVTSTVLTLLVLPAVYKWFAPRPVLPEQEAQV
jgi:cobalt-zinc-cadmium resistance protein CzcA